MKALLCTLSLTILLTGVVHGWGGLFNRFSPELLSNLGYGGFSSYKLQPLISKLEKGELEEVMNEQSAAESQLESCYGKKCTANEHCCSAHACVDVDGVLGTCLPTFGAKQGEMCERDGDCESGLICSGSDIKTCVPVADAKKQYGEDCIMSSDCDITKGLCCQVQRRHRQAPRKACSYFKDPLICVGPVAMEQIRERVEHTAGEKRITDKADAYNHLR
jgi:hypothetical protein